MLPRSFSPPASMPAVENFKTPKPVNIRNRTNVKGRESGQSKPSESFAAANQSASNSDSFSSQTRLSLESVRSGTSSSNAINSTEDPASRRVQPQPQYSQHQLSGYCPGNPIVSYSGDSWRPYNNIPLTEDYRVTSDVGGFPDRDVMEMMSCPVQHSFPNPVRVAGYPHMLLTDTDKLQQFSNRMAYSKDGAMRGGGGVLGQPPIFDTDQVKQPIVHRMSPGGYCLTSQPSHQSLERRTAYALSSPEESFYHGAGAAQHDLTAWLQQHRQQLRQQQQLADNLPSSSQGRVASSLLHYSSTGNLLTTTTDDGSDDRVEMIKQAADDIIKAKDSIIERQKGKICQLETGRTASSSSSLVVGHNNLSSNRSSNDQHLETKLGATEYELREVKRTLESNLNIKDDIINCLNDKLKEKDSVLNNWETKCLTLKSDVESLQKEIASKERYVSDLPTPEEHYKNMHHIKLLKEENIKYEDVIVQLEKKLRELANDLQLKDSLIKVLDESNKDLKKRTEDIKASNKELLEKLSSKVDLLQLQQLQKDNRKVTGELESTRKLLDALNNRLQQQSMAHKSELMVCKEQLDQEAAGVTALQRQIRENEQLLKNYKQTIKEITMENQNLTEKHLKQEEELKELCRTENMEEQYVQQLLMKELNIGLCDLQALVKICLERANGQDPNLAALLGIRDSAIAKSADSITQTTCTAAISVNSLKYQLSKAKDLRHEIDKLREIISDKFAEDMSRRLTCNPQ